MTYIVRESVGDYRQFQMMFRAVAHQKEYQQDIGPFWWCLAELIKPLAFLWVRHLRTVIWTVEDDGRLLAGLTMTRSELGLPVVPPSGPAKARAVRLIHARAVRFGREHPGAFVRTSNPGIFRTLRALGMTENQSRPEYVITLLLGPFRMSFISRNRQRWAAMAHVRAVRLVRFDVPEDPTGTAFV